MPRPIGPVTSPREDRMNARGRSTKRSWEWRRGWTPLVIACMCAHLTACGSDEAGLPESSTSAAPDSRGRIAGLVWDDADGNGQLSRGDRPLRDVRVYLDLNHNG